MDAANFKVYKIQEDQGISPAITCIICYDNYPAQERVVRRWSSPLWILDYTWCPSLPTRVGSVRRPWRFRKAGTGHLYPPNTFFWEDFRGGTPTGHGGFFFFKGGDLAGLDRLILQGQYYAKFHDTEGKLGDLLTRLFGLPGKFGDKCFSAIQASMWDIFHTLLMSRYVENEDHVIEEVDLPKKEKTFSAQVEHYMRRHFSEKLSLESIAAALDVSPATLRSKFYRERKISPMARLTAIRIEIAKTGLLKGEKLRNIATRTGFYDEFHLSKAFKKITGQSPREFTRSFVG